uniref:F5/8 type C domain-containing protein n=2 Tax=Odontella aurita TaxID=265563 RepID=A0A7S4JB35_9STRA|mmetsp:Transcript_42940/g.130650  ORF Transcript_42940/g.130650 Transcript_42940/m.130650 type:complete len:124 (+) Transcript_42940:849-1220(+)
MRCRGEEYLQFRLSPKGLTKRISFFGLSIPPMPYGPLSVRHFRLDWSLDGETWKKGGKDHTLETIDMEGMQSFELSPAIDATYVRLVCLQNVVWAERFHYSNGASGPALTGLDCVGLYHVRMK